jgi:hypothetical protein
MKRIMLAWAILACGHSFSFAADPIKPALEIRIQSISKFTDYAGFVGDMVGQQDQFEQYANVVKAFAGKKGIEGFDIKRPIGLYGELTKDIHDSPVVLLIPIADEAAARNSLKAYAQLNLKPIGNGIDETELPNVPMPVLIRFADGYLQATLGNRANFDRAIAPKSFFGDNPPALADVKLHVERIPAETRRVLLGQIEFQLQREKDQLKENERSASKRAISGYILDGAAAMLKTVMDDTKTISLALTAKPDQELVAVDFKLIPIPGRPLADMIESAAKKPSSTIGRAAADNPMFRAYLNVALTEGQRKKLEPVIDDCLNEAEVGVDAFVAELFKKFLASIEPTLKSGDLDFSAVLDGPGSNNKHRLNLMLKMKKGLDLVDTLVEATRIIPAAMIEPKFDLEKIDGQKVHTFTIHEKPGKLEELFGGTAIWAGTSNDLLSLGFEADGKLLKSALAAKSTKGPIAEIDLAMGRLSVLLADDDKKTAMKKAVKEIAIQDSQADRIRLTVDGGSELSVSLTAKSKALKVFIAMDKVSKSGN